MTTKKKPTLNIFIGYDDREIFEYLVCRESILQTVSRPVNIYPLKHRILRDIGLFKREWKIEQDGTSSDLGDVRPFSTQFAFTRFLIPEYSKYLGTRSTDPALFLDSDFLSLRDPYELLDSVEWTRYPVSVVKHNYKPPNQVKMDGQSQSAYNRKLWSSLMLFNLGNPKAYISEKDVNEKTGSWLHQFSWLQDKDIGSISEAWNFVPDHSEARVKSQDIAAIHYTNGSPMMLPNCKYSAVFNNYLRDVLEKSIKNPKELSV